jgi:Domain of unknown function (DUF4384)
MDGSDFSMQIPKHADSIVHTAAPRRPVAKKAHLVLLSHSAFFVTVLLGVAFGMLTGNNTTFAEPAATVTVMAEGVAPFLKDMSLDEVRGRARDEARRNAIEQAVGVFVRSASVLHNSQITDELISSVSRGVIEKEQWADEQIEEMKDGKRPGPAMAMYRIKVTAQVRPVRVERRAGFDVRGGLNKTVFQDNEEALIKIRSTQPAYLHVFSVTQDGGVTLLLPNKFVERNQITPDQEVVFPNDTLRALGVRLRVSLPKGTKKAQEYIKVIATRKPISLVGTDVSKDVFKTYTGGENGMIQDVIKRLAQLEDEDWNETTLPYEVRP